MSISFKKSKKLKFQVHKQKIMHQNDKSPQTKENCINYSAFFPKLEKDEKINTEQFIKACQMILYIVSKMGKAFAPIKFDLNRNINLLSEKFNENPLAYNFIEDMILNEHSNGSNVSSEAVLWLRREIQFFARFFRYVLTEEQQEIKVSNDLSKHMRKAYEETLEKLHGWLGLQLFNILRRSLITRRELYYILSRHNKEGNTFAELLSFIDRMVEYVEYLEKFYYDNNLEIPIF